MVEVADRRPRRSRCDADRRVQVTCGSGPFRSVVAVVRRPGRGTARSERRQHPHLGLAHGTRRRGGVQGSAGRGRPRRRRRAALGRGDRDPLHAGRPVGNGGRAVVAGGRVDRGRAQAGGSADVPLTRTQTGPEGPVARLVDPRLRGADDRNPRPARLPGGSSAGPAGSSRRRPRCPARWRRSRSRRRDRAAHPRRCCPACRRGTR